MASTWTRIHQELSLQPEPLLFEMIERATREIEGERDDLDWKRALPKKPEAGQWSEFAKDVAAMANARGGLLVYGVRNDRVIEGVEAHAISTEHLYKWLRAHTQPFVGGVDIYQLEGNGKTVLVVDVPASAMAPHFVLGTSSRDKEQQAFAVPARFADHTTWLSEHEIERAYRDRFARQEDATKALQRHVAETREVVLGEGNDAAAWLIMVSRPTRPVPPLVPAPQRHQAADTLSAALPTAAKIRGEFSGSPMREALTGGPRVGLRRWVDGNFLTAPRQRSRGRLAMVELHHDGTVVYAVDVSQGAYRAGALPPDEFGKAVPVEAHIVQSGVCDAVALTRETQLARNLTSSTDLAATLVCDPDSHRDAHRFAGFIAVLQIHGFPEVPKDCRGPIAIRQVGYELAPLAGIEELRAAAASLASGLLNQFGVESQLL
ncbi:AlbA family DNA-binding domain-containing protein [Streptomyces tauricus]|uniref:AlbA family DNA-binding domain-containing protein n=1 Tax=Streptomyces tauricus TaxID=68274 RepID=UPI00382FE42F